MEEYIKAWVLKKEYFPFLKQGCAIYQMFSLQRDFRMCLFCPPPNTVSGYDVARELEGSFKCRIEIVQGTSGLAAADPEYSDKADFGPRTKEGLDNFIADYPSADDRAAILVLLRLLHRPDAELDESTLIFDKSLGKKWDS